MSDPVPAAMLILILYSAAVVYFVNHSDLLTRRKWRRIFKSNRQQRKRVSA
jgi:hypothetical protein